MPSDTAFLDATAQAELVRSGQASPLELVDAAIERVERLDGTLNAVVTPLFERAREAAGGELPDGPLRGVPFLLKDLATLTAGEPYRSEEHTSELQSRGQLVCRLLLEKKKQ